MAAQAESACRRLFPAAFSRHYTGTKTRKFPFVQKVFLFYFELKFSVQKIEKHFSARSRHIIALKNLFLIVIILFAKNI